MRVFIALIALSALASVALSTPIERVAYGNKGVPLQVGNWTKKDRSSTEIRHIRITQTGVNTMYAHAALSLIH
jgi:hypothetical protein